MNQFNLLLTIQTKAAIASLIGAVIVISVVLFLISTSSSYEEKHAVKEKVYKARFKYFLFLSAAIIVVLFTSLQYIPYKKFQTKADMTVSVVGMQWFWKMGQGVIDKSLDEFEGGNEIELPANKAIKFVVTSKDVNRNFAIYNSKGDLVAQTQAMPEYKNELQYTFPKAGEYEVLCLEYCGMPHGMMTAKIHVK